MLRQSVHLLHKCACYVGFDAQFCLIICKSLKFVHVVVSSGNRCDRALTSGCSEIECGQNRKQETNFQAKEKKEDDLHEGGT